LTATLQPLRKKMLLILGHNGRAYKPLSPEVASAIRGLCA
jgi:hypothetical protein